MGKDNFDLEKILSQNQQLIDSNLEYQQILQKTNEQVALWANPYSVMVAVLGVLFTVLAIAATIILWWQSREHRKMVREELDNVINKQRQEAIDAIEHLKKEKENELRNAAAAEKEGIKSQLKLIETKELEMKIGAPDLSQYMKKEDFLCDDCRSNQADPFSVMGRVSWMSRINFYPLSKRKCLSCGKDF